MADMIITIGGPSIQQTLDEICRLRDAGPITEAEFEAASKRFSAVRQALEERRLARRERVTRG